MSKRSQRRRGARSKKPDTSRRLQKKSPSPKALPGPAPGSLSTKRLWLFRGIAAVVVPLVLFAVVELALRIGGYGHAPELMMPCEVNGAPGYCDNIRFGWRFFPKNIAREPSVFRFPEEKGRDTYRIFVLGASAAKGVPDEAFSVGRVLEVMLRARYPETRFEVITAAAAAINSHVVLPIAKECADRAPDLLVVYLGNNEVVGPYGAGTVFAGLSRSLTAVRLGITLRGLRAGQLMASAVGSAGGGEETPRVWRGLEMFLGKQVRRDAPELEIVYDHFAQNLRDIVDAGRDAGVPVILSTVASNLKDSPPFASLHDGALSRAALEKWIGIYRQGVAFEAEGRHEEALGRYKAAAGIDDAFADLHFRMARNHAALGDHRRALAHYTEARELDTLRFRADDRINQIIRQTATTAKGTRLADAVKAFADASPHGAPGASLFLEHVHFTFDGVHLLARTLLAEIEQVLPDGIRRKRPPGAVPDVETCRGLLAHTEWDRRRITRGVLSTFLLKPPFTNQLYQAERLEGFKARIRELDALHTPERLKASARRYEQAISRRPQDWMLYFKYGTLLAEDLRALPAAAAAFEKVTALIPHSWLGPSALGTVRQGQGKLAEAIREFDRALVLNPVAWDTQFLLAKAHKDKGDLAEATARFTALIEAQPTRVPAYQELSDLLFSEGQRREAREVLERGLALLPDSAVLHATLGDLYAREKNWDQAAARFKRALAISPDAKPIRAALERTERMRGSTD